MRPVQNAKTGTEIGLRPHPQRTRLVKSEATKWRGVVDDQVVKIIAEIRGWSETLRTKQVPGLVQERPDGRLGCPRVTGWWCTMLLEA